MNRKKPKDVILREKALSLFVLLENKDDDEFQQLLVTNLIFLGDLGYAGAKKAISMKTVKVEDSQLIAAERIRF
jgi:hypothetical protein